jgi:hypothetical protein
MRWRQPTDGAGGRHRNHNKLLASLFATAKAGRMAGWREATQDDKEEKGVLYRNQNIGIYLKREIEELYLSRKRGRGERAAHFAGTGSEKCSAFSADSVYSNQRNLANPPEGCYAAAAATASIQSANKVAAKWNLGLGTCSQVSFYVRAGA